MRENAAEKSHQRHATMKSKSAKSIENNLYVKKIEMKKIMQLLDNLCGGKARNVIGIFLRHRNENGLHLWHENNGLHHIS